LRYRLLGNSGLRVSEVCPGTMTFGEDWGWGTTEDDSLRMSLANMPSGTNAFEISDIEEEETETR
jgi:aryl-alcohol dehydrogenase-like predicted oxidoreductase